MTGTIITFYSYKGGTGRTMALSNIGWILASNGQRVLLIDWDLEAPGLHHYFQRFIDPGDASSRHGLIDFFWDLAAFAVDPLTADPAEPTAALPDLRPYAERLGYRFPRQGRIDLVRAGRQDRLFSQRVQDFDWKHFYEDLGGENLLRVVRDQLKQDYDWILIDSRTGLSDTSGICTVLMPDILVNCFVPNRQSIEGARAVADSVRAQRHEDIRIYPLPCRIENAEHGKLEQSRSAWRREHQRFLDESLDPENYWGSVEVPYRTIYAFEESLAVLIDRPKQVDTVLAACERFTSFLTNGTIQKLIAPAEGEGAPVSYQPKALTGGPVRVFISYSHDSAMHEELVRSFWLFLRQNGIDARLDLAAAASRADWEKWVAREIRDADYVLVIPSAGYRRKAEDADPADASRHLAFEHELISELVFANPEGLQRVLPVLLPDSSPADIPVWLKQASGSYHLVREFTVAGAEQLLRQLTGQLNDIEARVLPARGDSLRAGTPAGTPLPAKVLIEADVTADGRLVSAVWLFGSLLCQREEALPADVARVWKSLRLPPPVAADRIANAGRRLASALMDKGAQKTVGLALEQARGGSEVILSASGSALSLPVELIRLAQDDDSEVGPLALLPHVSVSRQLAPPSQVPGRQPPDPAALTVTGWPGPLKVLVAVAAPDETTTRWAPLDIEAEMQAVLDAVSGAAGGLNAQVRILEVASLSSIRGAVEADQYHVLHLSAHGSKTSVELEDEDGAPVQVDSRVLMQVLRNAGRPVPLIVLSAHSDGAADSLDMAAGLIAYGANRVIVMLAEMTQTYAAALGRHLYRLLATRPELTVGQALAQARFQAAEDSSIAAGDGTVRPDYGVATLVTAGADDPLVDPSAPAAPLSIATLAPRGKSVWDLPIGALIGRRPELRTVMGVLRRTVRAVERFGAATGVVLTGVGGIGKTALAGRVMSRLADEGWLIAVHEGRWSPAALIASAGQAVAAAAGTGVDPAGALASAAAMLADPGLDDAPKLAMICQLLGQMRLLVLLDDFEQNLSPGGDAFLDPAVDEVITALSDAASTGALLFTSRYPLPGPDRFLVQVALPPLSAAELQRLFLRLPALRNLDAEDKRLLTRTIGGHPRLVEFTDALLRGGSANLRHVQVKLRGLAREQGIDLGGEGSLQTALDQAMLLGSADVLLAELVSLLSPEQAGVLRQIAVCRAPMLIDDLAFALAPDATAASERAYLARLRADVDRLRDLTLLVPGTEIVMHPWTASLVTRNIPADLDAQHERALAMRFRRFEQQRGSYDDLVDISYHLAALRRYDDLADIAYQAGRIMPGTLATTAYLAEIRPLVPPDERAWILIADLEAQALLIAGDLPSADRLLRSIHSQVEARVAADPGSTEWQRDLSISHNKLGDIAVAAGDLDAARTAYQAALDIATRLAAADPANTGSQRDLSISYGRLGDVAAAAGDLDAARTAYQAALDIRVRLAAADPANTEWQRDLSISHDRLGDVAAAAGDLDAARTAYQAALDIRVRLAAADPANTEWQRDLSISHDRLGDVAAAAGDLDAARTAYQAGLDLAARLAAADPANTEWQRDLSISYNKLGDIAVAAGDLDAARTAYQAALDIRVRLAAADPANTGWQRDLSISYNKLGDIAAADGDLDSARTAYQAALDIATRLAAADPANTGWQRDLSVSQERLRLASSGTSRAERAKLDVYESSDAAEGQQFRRGAAGRQPPPAA